MRTLYINDQTNTFTYEKISALTHCIAFNCGIFSANYIIFGQPISSLEATSLLTNLTCLHIVRVSVGKSSTYYRLLRQPLSVSGFDGPPATGCG